MPTAAFQISVDARMIYDRLLQSAVGETVTYAELSKLIGRDVQGLGRGAMQTARHKAMVTHRMVFDAVISIGLKRLNDAEIVNSGERDIRHVRRQSTRAVHKMSTVEFSQLTNESKIKHNTFLSIFGALSVMTRTSSQKQIAKAVEESTQALPLAKTLEIFQK